jgi:regulation of enolase protein 1 (concanavalin A-like superfamily)
MFRDGSTANAANVTLVATPGNGVSFQWRTTPGAETSNYTNVGTIPAPTPSAPVWLQLVRNGNVFTASYSTNGTTYTVIGSQTITLSNSLLAGLAVTSHNNALSTTATFANVAIPVSGGGTVSIPGTPALVANPATGAVSLSWSTVSGATTYNLYRSTTSGGEGTTPYLTGLTGTTYSDTAVTVGTPYYYTLTAVNTAGQSGQSTQVSATPTAASSSGGTLADADFGGPGIAGSASYNSSSGVYTVSGGGADIWGTADQFNFDSTSVAGNATLTAEVTSLTATDPWAKAGLMFRDGSTANAANVAVVATPGNGVSFQWRVSAGGASSNTDVAGIPAPTPSTPVWLQLVRNGNIFTASYSTNGTTYTVIGSQTITLSNSLLAGLAVTSHNNALSTTATFANVAIPVSGGGTVSIPGTPTLVANPATGAVSLSWSTVSGATTYNLYRSTTSGGEGTTPYLIGLTGTTYSDTAVTAGTPYYYTLTAVNSAGQSVQSTQVSATPTASSSSGGTLADADFGSPGVAGSASYNSSTGVYTVSGGGSDIWLNNDQFNFASTTVAGNATLTAEITSLTGTDPWTKAGLMFRDGTAANSPNVTVLITPGNGISFQWRLFTGDSSASITVPGIPAPTPSAPLWLRLTRSGNVFTAYYSTNGTTYTLIGSQTAGLSNSLSAGLAVTAHNNSLLATATFANTTL